MKNFKQIQSFIVVAELHSFSRAAEQQCLSVMAVSKQVKALEQAIGEQLFVRSTRKVSLTEFGERFYQQCKGLQNQWQEVDSFIQHHKHEPQGTLRVCVSHAFGKHLLIKQLKAFNKQYRKIKLEIIFSEEPMLAEFQQGMFDILFAFPELPGITDNLKYRLLYQTNNYLCASKDFIKQYGLPKSTDDLIYYKFINHSLRQPGNQIPLADGGRIMTSQPEIVMNSFESLMTACRDGLGIFLTGDLLADKYLDDGSLVRLFPELSYRQFQLYSFYRPMNYEQPKIRAFIDFYS